MLNLGYKNWLLPYVEGTLDPRRAAILDARLKVDPDLAVEVESLRKVTSHIRASVVADKTASVEHGVILATRPSVWPRVESAITVRGGSGAYAPRFALAGGFAVAAVAAVYWVGVGHSPSPPASIKVAVNAAPHSTPKLDTPSTPAPMNSVAHKAPVVFRQPLDNVVASNDTPPETVRSVLARPTVSTDTVEIRSDDDAKSSPRLAVMSTPVHIRPIEKQSLAVHTVPILAVRPSTSEPMMVADNSSTLSSANAVFVSTDAAEGSASLPAIPVSEADGLTSPFAPYTGGGAMSSKAITSVVNVGYTSVNPTSNVEDGIKTLRDRAAYLTAHSKSSDLHESLNAWRDAALIDVNSSVEQNSTTSTEADDTFKMLKAAGSLPDFCSMMRDECARQPGEVASWRMLGHATAVQGQTADAVDAWSRASASSGASAEDWYQLGLAQEAVQNSAGAVTAYSKVLDLGEASRQADATARLSDLRR